MINRTEITIAPNAQPVPVAEFRNRIELLERKINVDRPACINDQERARWVSEARQVAATLIATDCKRATARDWTRRERAIDRATDCVIDWSVRFGQLA